MRRLRTRERARAVSSELWTDAELETSVETYLYLLRLEESGIRISEREMSQFLVTGALRGRNEASIRYRMRNISAVMEGRGQSHISAYSPANQVGSGVRERIEKLLGAHPMLAPRTETKPAAGPATSESRERLEALRDEALARLEALRDALRELDGNFGGIGHNQPPERIEEPTLTTEDVREAIAVVEDLQSEVAKANPDRNALDAKGNRLARFGLKIAAWAGERATKFADAALVTLAPVLVAKATNVLPLITDAVGALMKFVTHLPM